MEQGQKSIPPKIYAAAILFAVLCCYAAFSFFRISQLAEEQGKLALALENTRGSLLAAQDALKEKTAQDLKDIARSTGDRNAATGDALAALGKRTDALDQKMAAQEKKPVYNPDVANHVTRATKILLESASQAMDAISYLLFPLPPAAKEDMAPVAFADLPQIKTELCCIIDGAGGRDKINSLNLKDVDIDGVHLISIEKYDLADNRPEAINIQAPGLNNLDSNWLEISAEPKLDTVKLDGCLKWKKQKSKTGAATWLATDIKGETRTVTVTQGVPVAVSKSCDNRYAQINANREFPFLFRQKTKVLAIDRQKETSIGQELAGEARADAPQAEPERNSPRFNNSAARPEHYSPDRSTAIALYKKWSASIRYKPVTAPFDILISLMEKGSLPTEFIRAGERVGDKDKAIIGMIPLGEATTTIANGNMLLFPGKDDDTIDAGPGTTIVVLEKGWGKKTIQKTCPAKGTAANLELYIHTGAMAAFGGIGLQVHTGPDGDALAVKALGGYPAAREGIQKDDILLSADGRSFKGMAIGDVANLLRGDIGSKLLLTYQRPGEPKPRTAILTRELIGHDLPSSRAAQGLAKTDYKWPYPYESFIVFGPGISPADMEEKKPRFWVNRKTGDTLEANACFNFVYSDD